jgi:hypothetical protein
VLCGKAEWTQHTFLPSSLLLKFCFVAQELLSHVLDCRVFSVCSWTNEGLKWFRLADLPQVSGILSGVVNLVQVDEPSQIFLLLFSPVSRWVDCFWHIVGIGLAFCEKDEPISV